MRYPEIGKRLCFYASKALKRVGTSPMQAENR
jgi:hypothetical protein